MIVCEKTRLRPFVLLGCFIKVSLARLHSFAFSLYQKSAYVTASSDTSLRRIRRCTVLRRSE